jgi:hypothetical protein
MAKLGKIIADVHAGHGFVLVLVVLVRLLRNLALEQTQHYLAFGESASQQSGLRVRVRGRGQGREFCSRCTEV